MRIPRTSLSAAVRSVPVLLLALLLGAGTAAAQQARHDYWKRQIFPVAWYHPRVGVAFEGRASFVAPVPYDWPQINAAELRVRALVSTNAYYGAAIRLEAPAWLDGWRFLAIAGALRETRFGYYGVGNDTPYDDDIRQANSRFNDTERTGYVGRADLQRRIIGPLRGLAGVLLRRVEFGQLDTLTLFNIQVADGTISSDQLSSTRVAARLGLVLDTRDSELDPRRGVLAEAIISPGTDFTRYTGHLRGYASIGERLRFAGRLIKRSHANWQ